MGVAVTFVVLWVAADLLTSALHPTPGVSAWYLGAGLTVAVLFRCGVAYAPLLIVAELVRWSLGHTPAFSWWAAAAEGAVVAAIYGSAVAVLGDVLGVRLPLVRARDAVLLCAGAAGVAAALNAAASVGLLVAVHDLPAASFAALARYFWLGDAVGILAIVPAVAWIAAAASGHTPPAYRRSLAPPLEIALVAAVALLGFIAFGILALDPLRLIAFAGTFVPLGVLAWTSGVRGAILGSAALDATLIAADALSRVPETVVANGQLDVLLQSTLALALGGMSIAYRRDRALLRFLALHDPQTALPNRVALEQWVRRQHGGETWLLCAALDHFGILDVGMERSAADALLHVAAQRIADAVPGRTFLARLDSSAFVVAGEGSPASARAAAASIVDALRAPLPADGAAVRMTVSIGVAAGRRDARALLIEANAALREAREDGGNRVTEFAPPAAPSGAHLVADLTRARDRREFLVYYQPIHRLDEGDRVGGIEALLRWRHPVHGILPPSVFLDALERSALLEEIEPWIAREACATAARLLGDAADARLWLNVGAASLLDPAFVDHALRAAEAEGLGVSRLVIEVTERIVAESDVLAPIGARIAAAGASLAIDDFGTGHSSLGRMRTIQARYLKLDRSLVSPVDADERGRALAAGTIELAHRLDADVVAEGIETAAQAEFFRSRGCRYGQGFALSRPMDAAALGAFLARTAGAR